MPRGMAAGVMQVDVRIPSNVTPSPAIRIEIAAANPNPGRNLVAEFSTQAGATMAVQ